MKTTSIYEWYKRVTNLVSKNIDKINIHGFIIDVSFMNIEEENKSITVHVLNYINNDCKVAYMFSITNYQEENLNKKYFKDFKNFLENIETLS